jgi:HAD superfamily hydrolase (TIGR01509 family)
MRDQVGGRILPPRMTYPSAIPRAATRRRRSSGPRQSRAVARSGPEVATQPAPALELDSISARWQLALDAAERALGAAGGSLPPSELRQRRGGLARERQQTAQLLAHLARTAGVLPVPWLSPVPVSTTMLGLPTATKACLFDLEGVLTDSALVHAQAWSDVFDEFLLRLSDKTGWAFIPFDRDADYRAYLDGRPRLEGVHAFLGSRGIRLPEGRPDDPAEADTACGLATRKGEALERRLHQQGVTALSGARRYLEAAGHAGVKRAVVSASASTQPMLELAGLATLLEERVDADVIRAEGLRARPAPDLLLLACRRLGVRPEETVTFTHNPAGVAAGLAGGLAVIGVGEGARGEALLGFGAERVVPSVSTLLDRVLSPPTEPRL